MSRLEVTFVGQHHSIRMCFALATAIRGHHSHALSRVNTNVKGNIGAMMLRSCWPKGNQNEWKKFLASVGVKKRAKDIDEPIEWFLDKYNKAAAIRDGF